MRDEFQRELERSTQRIRDALAPYNRFVRSERDGTQRFLSNVQESLAELERLRARLGQLSS
jgi:flagellar motility protein MotE (MotC chaperone)